MRRPKLPDWAKIRAGYEAGVPVAKLAMHNNVKGHAIRDRAAAESWGANASEERLQEEQTARRAEQQKRLAAAGALGVMSPEQRQALA
jgi:hypothetical protein